MSGRRRARRPPAATTITAARHRPQLLPAAILLFVMTVALYWNTRSYDFVWDDHLANLSGNRELLNDDYAFFWTQAYAGLYAPVTYTTWIWIKHVSEERRDGTEVLTPEGFRTANILLHATNAVLVLYLLSVLAGSPWIGLVGGVLFAVHPLQVEPVVWITEYRGLLSACFSLTSLALYCRYRQTASARPLFVVAASVAYVLALLSKPTAIVVPVAAVAIDSFVFRPSARQRWLVPLLWTIPAALVIWITRSAQPDHQAAVSTSALMRPLVAADAMVFYLGKLIAPVHLSVMYGRTPPAVLQSWRAFVLWPIPLAMLALAWMWRRTRPLLALGIVIAMIGIAPVSGLVPFNAQSDSTVADRYFYFSMLGVALAVTSILIRVQRPRWIWIGAAATTAVLVSLNLMQQPVWQSDLTLWARASVEYPNQPNVHNNYGVALQGEGRHDEAIDQFTMALQITPTFADAYGNRGASEAMQGNLRAALDDQTRSIDLDPTYARRWYNRAVTYYRLGRLEEALNDLVEAEARGAVSPELRTELEQRLGRGR
jgi:hypothetical protein